MYRQMVTPMGGPMSVLQAMMDLKNIFRVEGKTATIQK